ncbi:hypothetical protein FYJ24_10435 [Actinomycetaceae bacterium WB03_NA08]|uniref:Uncharacterized protein n=1 Tax=Scrofimicrobium canadense TaxID=2652290 RepID=A0A6N7VTR5_9ACTO|nr:hypothetical protein [Scrofimicrobium canadense]MSS85167.1 hypothetical protein [Scrofimicrobium canadense]
MMERNDKSQPTTEELFAELKEIISDSPREESIPSPEQNWREAENNDSTQPLPHTEYHEQPAPPVWDANPPATPAPAPVSKGSRVRVGLLIWAGLLIIGGLWIVFLLAFPGAGVGITLASLLGIFGIIFIVGAIAVAMKKDS